MTASQLKPSGGVLGLGFAEIANTHSGTKVEGRRAQAFKYDISIASIRYHFNMKHGLICSTKAKGIAFGRR